MGSSSIYFQEREVKETREEREGRSRGKLFRASLFALDSLTQAKQERELVRAKGGKRWNVTTG